jgi:hypothetical protein
MVDLGGVKDLGNAQVTRCSSIEVFHLNNTAQFR